MLVQPQSRSRGTPLTEISGDGTAGLTAAAPRTLWTLGGAMQPHQMTLVVCDAYHLHIHFAWMPMHIKAAATVVAMCPLEGHQLEHAVYQSITRREKGCPSLQGSLLCWGRPGHTSCTSAKPTTPRRSMQAPLQCQKAQSRGTMQRCGSLPVHARHPCNCPFFDLLAALSQCPPLASTADAASCKKHLSGTFAQS